VHPDEDLPEAGAHSLHCKKCQVNYEKEKRLSVLLHLCGKKKKSLLKKWRLSSKLDRFNIEKGSLNKIIINIGWKKSCTYN